MKTRTINIRLHDQSHGVIAEIGLNINDRGVAFNGRPIALGDAVAIERVVPVYVVTAEVEDEHAPSAPAPTPPGPAAWTERQKRVVAAALELRANVCIATVDGKLTAMANASTVDAIMAFDEACSALDEGSKETA